LSRKIAEYSPNFSADKSHGTHITYYPSGTVKTQTDAIGNKTSFKYDAYGNATQKTNPDGTINVTEYDGLQREKASYFKSSANANKQILASMAYEFENGKLRTFTTTYISAEKQVVTETLADFRGNAVEEKTNGETKRKCEYYANGQLKSQTDALNNTTMYEYNYLNKLTKTISLVDERNSEVINEYDKIGNLVKTIQKLDNNKNSVTVNKYNSMGLLEKVTLTDNSANSEKNITKYFYNNAGVQTKMYTGMSSESDTSYLTTNYEYDSWMRPIRTTDSTGYKSGTITYDLNGNVLTNTDANGNVTTNTYDALNRVISSETVNSGDSSKNVSKSYEYDNMGRVKKSVSNGLTTTTIYDKLGRKYTEGEYDGNGYSTFKGFFYEGVSPYVSRELTGQYNLLSYSFKSYEYDSEMRISKVKESGKEIASYIYDANGNKKSETLANGVVSTYTYNKANRITKIENKSGDMTISSYEYSYYLDGSDACKVRSENGIIEKTEYEYDGLKRLTEESVKVGDNTTDTYSYEYDDYGNRSKMTAAGSENYVTEYNYNDAQGKYTALLQKEVKTVKNDGKNPLDKNDKVKQTVYTYDKNGNQVKKVADGKTEINKYNGLNQLIGFTDGETTASYKYNASGLRYEKTVDGQTINHVWDGSKQIIADVIDDQFYEADCYIRGTNLVAKYNYRNGNKSEYTYYTQNAHGDVVNLTNAGGEVVKSYTYDAFGVEKNIDENDTNAFRYCGEYYDTETGTVYLRARYYNPTTGRFISRDSFAGKNEDPLSLNRYTYCHNNPILYFDPSGHIAGVDDAVFWGCVGLVYFMGACGVLSMPQTQQTLNDVGKAVDSKVSTITNTVVSGVDSLAQSYLESQIHPNINNPLNEAFANPIPQTQTYIAHWTGYQSQVKIKEQAAANTKVQTKFAIPHKKPNQSVYLLYDPNNNNSIEYVGRTENLNARKKQHESIFSPRNHLEMIPIASNIPYSVARGLEQWGIEYYNTYNPVRFGGNAYNDQIYGISLINPLRTFYFADAVPYASNLTEVMEEYELTLRE